MTGLSKTYSPFRHRLSRSKTPRNHNLLCIAQELFNGEIVRNTSNISTCRRASLLDIAEYLNGLAMQKYPTKNGEVGLPVLKIKELGQQECDMNSDRCSESIPEQFIVKDGDIIFSWSGTLMVDFWCGGRCGLNQHLFKVRSEDYPDWFVYFWTKTPSLIIYLFIFANKVPHR